MNKNEDIYMFEYEGLRCIVLKTPDIGNYCGYVEIPENHPFYQCNYIGCDSKLNSLDVHGGITFSDDSKELCYELSSNFWCIGFDCAHAGDFVENVSDGHKWTFDEVKAEVEKLAKQVKDYA